MSEHPPTPTNPPDEAESSGGWFVLPLVLVATGLLYLRSLSGELVYDDLLMIGRNPWIASLANIPTFFRQGYWDFLEPEQAAHIGYWRPLTATSLALAHALGDGGTAGFHVLSLLVHLGATGAAFLLARRLGTSTWIAGFTALVFGLHPIHVESVAWITALNDPLFGLFALLSAASFVGWRARGSRGWPVASCVWFALALLSKELAAAVLPALVALDLGRRRTGDAEEERGADPFAGLHSAGRAYGPLLAVFAVYYVARIFVFASPWAGFDRITTDFGVGTARLLLLRLELLGGGLGLLAWPLELNLFRPFRPYLGFTDPSVLAAALATAVFIGLCVWSWLGRQRPLLAALLFVPAGLLPILIRVESLGSFPLSDRFLYLPVFGFGLVLSLLVQRALPKRVATAVMGVICLLYAAKSYDRIGFWQNEETLFKSAAQASARSPYVQWGLGRVLLDHYRKEKHPRQLEEAFAVYEGAQDLLAESKEPRTDIFVTSRDFLQIHLGLGWCLLFDSEQAGFKGHEASIALWEELARRIREIEERSEAARALGIQVTDDGLELEQVYTAIGVAHTLAGRPTEAQAALEQALAIHPRYPEAHQNLGRLYAKQGDWEAAEREFRLTREQRPGNYEDALLLAQALYSKGSLEEAEELARELVERYPDRVEAIQILIAAGLSKGDLAGALRWVDEALTLDPRIGFVWYQKGTALKQLGDAVGAIEALAQAVSLMPNNFEAHYDLSATLLEEGYVEQAIPLLVQSYALSPSAEIVASLAGVLEEVPIKSPQTYFELASIDRKRRSFESAEAWLDRAVALDPRHGDSLFARGQILRERGDNEAALDYMTRGAELLPGSFVAQSELGLLLADMRRNEEALARLQRALQLAPPTDWDPQLVSTMRASIEARMALLR